MSMFSQVNGPDLARSCKNERSNHVIKKGEPHAAFTLEFYLMDQYEIVSSLPYFHHWNILKSYYMKMDDFFLTMETPQERSKKLPHSL